jgi:hypothetical protein
MRKVVFIPVFSLAGTPQYYLLELIVEPAEFSLTAQPKFHYLQGHGLKSAVHVVKQVMVQLKSKITVWRPSRAPLLYLANPLPGLSNALGAALGMVMSLLMYYGLCRCERLIATGRLNSVTATVEAATDLTAELKSAMALGYQNKLLRFIIPKLANDDMTVVNHHDELICHLGTLNIRVFPVQTLQEAIAACSD